MKSCNCLCGCKDPVSSWHKDVTRCESCVMSLDPKHGYRRTEPVVIEKRSGPGPSTWTVNVSLEFKRVEAETPDRAREIVNRTLTTLLRGQKNADWQIDLDEITENDDD